VTPQSIPLMEVGWPLEVFQLTTAGGKSSGGKLYLDGGKSCLDAG